MGADREWNQFRKHLNRFCRFELLKDGHNFLRYRFLWAARGENCVLSAQEVQAKSSGPLIAGRFPIRDPSRPRGRVILEKRYGLSRRRRWRHR